MAGRKRDTKAGKPPKTVRAPGAMLWWGGLACGAMVVLSPASAVLLLSLIVPVLLVALLPEGGSGGRVAQAALLFGLAASIHPLELLWQAGATLPVAMRIARQPLILFTAWMAVLAGWLVNELAAIVLKLAADLTAASERRAITASLAKLETEWGPLATLDATMAR